jgi:3-hydroxyacyl-CoA dehydrogenase
MVIEKACVLGAGTMGAQIAAHFANARIPCLLLDIPPRELTKEETAAGRKLTDKVVRNRIAQAGLEMAKKARPAAFFAPDLSSLVSVGNFEDDLKLIKDCDLIIEAVVENLEIKKKLFSEVDKYRSRDAVIASNTSGIPIRHIAEGQSDDFKSKFLGIHFFNPPRYLHLVEVIPTEWTNPDVTRSISTFLDLRLGKGVVLAKDRPNFIANRIGTYGAMVTIKTMLSEGYRIEEVDKITGDIIGRPKMGTFRLFDLVGLDIFVHVSKNLHEAVTDDDERDIFIPPDFLNQMVARNILGNKTGSGFYRKQKGEGDKSEIWSIDIATLDYKPGEKIKLPSLDMAKNVENVPERIKTLVWSKDRVGNFLWKTISKTLTYSAKRIPEISDNIVDVDRAMRWGFNWELGVFEVWDAIGVEKSVQRMKEEGIAVPQNVQKMLDSGARSFYKTENGQNFYFDLQTGNYKPLDPLPGTVQLSSLKERQKVIKKNPGASLIDLGDGVACLEFHSKMNAIGGDTLQMLKFSLEEVEKNFLGLVVGNEGQNFSVGANLMLLLLEAQEENWEEIDLMIRAFQNATMSLRYSQKPVVVAPFQMALGGGCEMVLHGDRVHASAESYMGLVEIGVGLIPAGGGTKEMLVRAMNSVPKDMGDTDPFPFVKKAFETIALAKVSTSVEEAKGYGFLTPYDTFSMNSDRLIADAKQVVIGMSTSGYLPPVPRTDIPALGETALATLKLGIHLMLRAGYITEHEKLIATKLARIHTTKVSEQYLLDLEREAFLSLCGERKTQERISHMLKKGKPLRN